ncbi:peroxisomal membrane protein PMP22-like [Actinidia eriantha]|uniref:peroxisomal membrane protein PMP22-like n=1 Tax=Actinidia eriantha TaxID=165200 RepID=UPI0025853BBB|nr:peroxisomal membrane protein PMP22-like [Actinidia eriantha]
MGSIAKKGLQHYLLQLQHHPLRTKALTAGAAISDIVSQKLTGIQKLQLRRLLLKVIREGKRLFFLGSTRIIFLMCLFIVGIIGANTNFKPNQFNLLLQGMDNLRWINVQFWPVAGWINHQYVPLQFRVIFQSVIVFCWGIFLNLRARSTALTKD